jgi:hypothetical protein
MLICLYRRNLLNMDKKLFLIFIFATAFSLNNCMDDEFTHEILTFTARQLIKLYDVEIDHKCTLRFLPARKNHPVPDVAYCILGLTGLIALILSIKSLF